MLGIAALIEECLRDRRWVFRTARSGSISVGLSAIALLPILVGWRDSALRNLYAAYAWVRRSVDQAFPEEASAQSEKVQIPAEFAEPFDAATQCHARLEL